MTHDLKNLPVNLNFEELGAIYSISQVVADSTNIDEALKQITEIIRPLFIFDNAVVYLNQGKEIEPIFAKAIGRGRSNPEAMGWGEIAARFVIEEQKIYIHNPTIEEDDDRTSQDFYLGMPMKIGGQVIGAVIFIRFGGPKFEDTEINFAQYVTSHITQIFEFQRLVERVSKLDSERRLIQIQDDFIAMVSHELNTPLGFIKGYTTTLLRKDAKWDEETTQEFLTIIDEEADRLNELIDNLIDSSRLQSATFKLKTKVLQLEEIIPNALEITKSRYNKINYLLEKIHPNIKILGDPKRLGQVFDNLASNAQKYAPGANLIIRCNQTDGRVIIEFEDNGPGIPKGKLSEVFDRFFRVSETSAGVRGTGLGLNICKKIIEAHAGTISVESELGKGTKFIVNLPSIDS